MPKQTVETFSKQFGIDWPSGYSLQRDTIAKLGVANSGMGSMPGYGLVPTVYLMWADGTVVWSDESARYRHQDAKTFTENLKTALDTQLTARKLSTPKR